MDSGQLIGQSGNWHGHVGGAVGGNTMMGYNPDLQIPVAVVVIKPAASKAM